MSTRSNVGIINEDGSVEAVYCHFDGYLTGVGQELIEHYNSRGYAENLVMGGDMSSLGNPYDDASPAQHYPSKEAYLDSLAGDIFIEYAYLWDVKEGRWMFVKGNIYDQGEIYDGDIPLDLKEAVDLQRRLDEGK